ncbi:hypothetical protein T492DRAFT_309231 [Pavlovales sp. CCMP2436]|nr:hypothetical protein T492DRAFT_309231 [Pavlovales sp. CCMP2436]
MGWQTLPSWATAAPTELDAAVRARLENPGVVGWRGRHARLDVSKLGLERLPTGREPALGASAAEKLAKVRELDASSNALGRPGAPPIEFAVAGGGGGLGSSLTSCDLSANELSSSALHAATLPSSLCALRYLQLRLCAEAPSLTKKYIE